MTIDRFPVTCAGCPCLCDDVGVTVEDSRIVATINACPQGSAFLSSLELGPVRGWVRGQEVPVEDAIQEAARLLKAAAMPAVLGLSESSVEAIREAVALTQALRGIIAPWPADPTKAWGQQTPDLGRTGAEIKAGDLVIFWRADPVRVQPRLLDRLRAGNPRLRTLLVTDAESENLTASIVRYSLRFPACADVTAVRGLRFHLERQEGLAGPLAPLAQVLHALRRCHVFLGMGVAGDEVLTGQWQLLAAHFMNRVRFSVSVLSETVTSKAATEVLAWLTGFPGPVSFATGQSVCRPGIWEAERLLAQGLTDVALCLGPCPVGDAKHIRIDRQEHPDAEVAFLVPGLSPELEAHVLRPDGIALRLAGAAAGETDPMVGLLARLRREIG